MKTIYVVPKIKAAQIHIEGIIAASPDSTLNYDDKPVDAGDARSKFEEGVFDMGEE